MIDMSRSSISEYTEAEFISFVAELYRADAIGTDEEADALFMHFQNICPHPSGTDLIYYAENGTDTSPEGIARTISEWCSANGFSSFKKDK